MKGRKAPVSKGLAPQVETIQRLAAATFGVSTDWLLGRSCRRKVVRCRQAAIHVACRLTPAPRAEIARLFGRHRSLIRPTLARAERLLREDADFASMVARIEAGSRRVLETEGGA